MREVIDRKDVMMMLKVKCFIGPGDRKSQRLSLLEEDSV